MPRKTRISKVKITLTTNEVLKAVEQYLERQFPAFKARSIAIESAVSNGHDPWGFERTASVTIVADLNEKTGG